MIGGQVADARTRSDVVTASTRRSIVVGILLVFAFTSATAIIHGRTSPYAPGRIGRLETLAAVAVAVRDPSLGLARSEPGWLGSPTRANA